MIGGEGREAARGAGAAEWSLTAVQQLLWQRRWLVIAIAAEVFLLTGAVTILRTPLYEASARVLIERATPNVLETEDVIPAVWNQFEIQRFYQTQYLLLKDPAVVRGALDAPGLREALSAELAPIEELEEGQLPPDDGQLAAFIRGRLTIQQLEYSSVVRVSFRHASPDIAARVVNAVVFAYRDFFVQTGLDAREGASEFLSRAIEEAQAEVLQLEAKLAAARSRIRTVLPTRGTEMGKSRLESLDQALTEAKATRAAAQARLSAWESAVPLGIEQVRINPQVIRYREDLTELKRERAELEARVGAGWPRLVELDQAIKETERNLDDELLALYQQALDSARADLGLAEQNERRLESLLDRELAQMAELQLQAVEFDALRQEYDQKRNVLNRLLERREEVAVTKDLQQILERQVHVIEQASPPRTPAVPRVKVNLALGLAFGLFLGVAAAFLAEALDNKIRHADQLQQISKLPLLGSIPRLEAPQRPRRIFSRKSRARSDRTPVIPASQHGVEEAFRALRSALLLAQPERPPRSVLITSALPGEGKSTIAANLGRTLAAFGHRVILIDADLRHPRLHRVLRVSPERGLTNVLASPQSARELIQPTSYPNLSLLPGGPCPPDPATLLDGKIFREVIHEFSDVLDYEFVLVDTPPVLVFADALNLVPVVESTVLVARAMRTPKDAVRQAVEQLAKVKAHLTGTVLNGEQTEESPGSYYRSYHYYRGGYRKVAEKRARDRASEAASSDKAQTGSG
ncbi:MAG: polysaccharide biosynthesis tyrosine autokinase [Acidobacteriota bacterium]|nr:MAG: polysaccharide biosynthesis tyrosine autokinase [Acidobacteriota bacterium]